MPYSDNLTLEFLGYSPVIYLLSHESSARIMHRIQHTWVSGLELRSSDVLIKQISKPPCWPLNRQCFYLSSVRRHIEQMYRSNIYQLKIIRKVILKQLFNICINFIIYLIKSKLAYQQDIYTLLSQNKIMTEYLLLQDVKYLKFFFSVDQFFDFTTVNPEDAILHKYIKQVGIGPIQKTLQILS